MRRVSPGIPAGAGVSHRHRPCPDWVDAPPVASEGLYVVGRSGEATTEQAARNRALNNAAVQAIRAAGLGYEVPAGPPAVRAEEWCVEPVTTDKGTRYTASVLGFLTEGDLARLRTPPASDPAQVGPGAGPPTSGAAAAPAVEVPGSFDRAAAAPQRRPGGPPAAPGRVPGAARAEVAALIQAVRDAPFTDEQLALIRTAAPTLRLRVADAREIVRTLSFDDDRLAAIGLLRSCLVDPENGAALAEEMSFSSGQDEVRAMFE